MSSYITAPGGGKQINKGPDEVLDYPFDWTAWLAKVTDTIATYTITVTGATKGATSQTGGVVVAWISGGTVGTVATVLCEIVTAGGRTAERTAYLNIVNR